MEVNTKNNSIDSLTEVNRILFEVVIRIKQRENRYPDPVINKLIIDAMKELKAYE